MDTLAACRAFVSVSDAGSFTIGAAAAQIPQSVASRRVAALEQELGGRLLDRTGRRATLTPFGTRLLPRARRLVELGDALTRDAVKARRAPVRMAVPAVCPSGDLARLGAAGREAGVVLQMQPAEPAERAELLRVHDTEVAIQHVAPAESLWSVPLGLASGRATGNGPVLLESLRPGRGSPAGRGTPIWVQPEDDVPIVRDRLIRFRDAAGLAVSQVQISTSLVDAVTEALSSGGLLLCSARQARQLGLHWRPIVDIDLTRTYACRGVVGSDAHNIAESLRDPIGRALGVEAEVAA